MKILKLPGFEVHMPQGMIFDLAQTQRLHPQSYWLGRVKRDKLATPEAVANALRYAFPQHVPVRRLNNDGVNWRRLLCLTAKVLSLRIQDAHRQSKGWIVSVAMKPKTGSVIEGRIYEERHCHLVHHMSQIGFDRATIADSDQGFMVSWTTKLGHHYVSRERAARIALANGQIDRLEYMKTELDSSDVW